MAVKFWLGGERSDKSDKMLQYIIDEAEKNETKNYLLVVPEQYTLSAQREIIKKSRQHGMLNIDVLSFMRLAHRISDEVGSYDLEVTTLDDLGKNLILQLLAGANRDKLTVFSDNVEKLGYISKIKSIISEFMQYGISTDKVNEMAASAQAKGKGLLAGKLRDIDYLYEKFLEFIKDRYTTTEETLDRIASLVSESDTVRNSVIVFDGFTGFTPVQAKLIGTLLEYANDIHAAFVIEENSYVNQYDGRNLRNDNDRASQNNSEISSEQKEKDKKTGGTIPEHDLFYMSKHAMKQLEKLAEERHVEIKEPYKAWEDGNSNCGGKITASLFAGLNPEEEIRMTAMRIGKLVREEGLRYRDISVLCPDIDIYRHSFERVFEKAGIPYFIDRTQPLLLNPFVEYIRSLPFIFADNYSYESVFRFLKSGLSDIDMQDVSRLENYCLAAGIKGRKAWHTRFTAQTRNIKADEVLIAENIRCRVIEATDRFADELGLKDAASVNTVRNFAIALYNSITAANLEEKLKAAADDFTGKNDLAMAQEYSQIYPRVMDILDEIVELIPDEKVDIRGFCSLLDAGLDCLRIGIAPKSLDYVQIGDLTRSRVGDVNALFIVGANEGQIPKAAPAGGIINENDRQFLTGNDADLVMAPTAKEDAYAQRLYLYMAVNKPKEKLFISYSKIGNDGKSQMPSYIVRQFKNNENLKVEIMESDVLARADTPEYAFEELTYLAGSVINGSITEPEKEVFTQLLEFCLHDPDYHDRTVRLVTKAFIDGFDDKNDPIGKAIAHAIYGKSIVGSVTRLETYANCAYRYFLQYGLKLNERELFTFEMSDLGSVFHDSIAEYSRLIEASGQDWFKIDDDTVNSLIDRAVETTIQEKHMAKLYSSARMTYMVSRIKRIMRRTAGIVTDQVRRGEFVPKYFEVDFEKLDSLNSLNIRLSDDEYIKLKGRIDRVDTAETEEGIYVKIVDYKSSEKKMNLAAIYEGRQLQLLVYLNAAMENEKNLSGKNVIPAGVLYYHIDDPVISDQGHMNDNEIRLEIMKNLRMNGLINSDENGRAADLIDMHLDEGSTVIKLSHVKSGELRKSDQTVTGEEFNILTGYVGNRIADMGKGILEGNISIPKADGINRFTDVDCTYCDYSSICLHHNSADADDGDKAENDENADGQEAAGSSGIPDRETLLQMMKEKI